MQDIANCRLLYRGPQPDTCETQVVAKIRCVHGARIIFSKAQLRCFGLCSCTIALCNFRRDRSAAKVVSQDQDASHRNRRDKNREVGLPESKHNPCKNDDRKNHSACSLHGFYRFEFAIQFFDIKPGQICHSNQVPQEYGAFSSPNRILIMNLKLQAARRMPAASRSRLKNFR